MFTQIAEHLKPGSYQPQPYQLRKIINADKLRGASGATVRVYNWLRDTAEAAIRAGRKWICPRLQTIANELGIDYRTARRAKQWLKRRGLIATRQRHSPRHQDNHTKRSDWIMVFRHFLGVVTTTAKKLANSAAETAEPHHEKQFHSEDISDLTPEVSEKKEEETTASSSYTPPKPLYDAVTVFAELTKRKRIPLPAITFFNRQ